MVSDIAGFYNCDRLRDHASWFRKVSDKVYILHQILRFVGGAMHFLQSGMHIKFTISLLM
jgi:hypothetical protein